MGWNPGECYPSRDANSRFWGVSIDPSGCRKIGWQKAPNAPPKQSSRRDTSGTTVAACNGNYLKSLALPRGLRQASEFNHIAESGTRDRSTQSLGFLPRVSHRQHRGTRRLHEDVALSEG